MREIKKTNEDLITLIQNLKSESRKHDAPIWRDLAKRFEKSNKRWAQVNVSHITRYAKKDDIIVIPGKLLGSGYIDIPVTIAAFQSSENAREKITNAGGKILTILDLIKKNPKGTNIRIFSK